MEWYQALILGLVQGLTEFLPVSSSAHLVIAQKLLLNKEVHDLAFDLVAHLATTLAIFVFFHALFRKMFGQLAETVRERKVTVSSRIFMYVFWASIPTAAIGLAFKDYFEESFSNITETGVTMIITGVVLWLTRYAPQSKKEMHIEEDESGLRDTGNITVMKSVLIGIAQGISISPGISRSGATIATALFLGVEKSTAAYFSFVMSIPAILGAAALELKDINWLQADYLVLSVGFLSAFASGLFGLWAITKVVSRGRLEIFTPYMFVVGAYAIYIGVVSH